MHSPQTIQRPPKPNLGLVLTFGSVTTIALWYCVGYWYSIDAYPILLNPWYASETMMIATHYSVVFAPPLLGGLLGYSIARKLQRRLPALSERVQSWLNLLGLFPLFILLWGFLFMLYFFTPNLIGVTTTYQNYDIRFTQSYSYDPFRTKTLAIGIT